MFGSWPIAANTPSASSSQVSSVLTSRSRTPVTRSSPSTSSTTAFVTHSILSFARARSSMICEARNSSRRCTIVTLAAKRVEEGRLLHGRVAAADHDDVLVGEEGGVTGRAVRDAAALQLPLRLEPELAGGGAGRDDHGLGAVLVVADPDAVRALREVDLRHVVGDEVRAEALGLAAEVCHHLRAHDALGVARVVLHVARDHQLAAPVEALDHERLQVRACSVKGGRIPGRARRR